MKKVVSTDSINFDYLSRHIISALDLINKERKNILLGGFTSAIIEFLGRCIRSPQKEDSKDNFYKFIEDYLRKYDERYSKYKELLYRDFRCGAAHTIMPKGTILLSFDENDKRRHLKTIKDSTKNSFHLKIYSPKLIEDLKNAIEKFIDKAKKDHSLGENYKRTISYLQGQLQKDIDTLIPEEDRENAIVEKVIHDTYRA